jgi:hypothetical protein
VKLYLKNKLKQKSLGGMVHVVEHFPSKLKAVSSSLSITKKRRRRRRRRIAWELRLNSSLAIRPPIK